MCQMQRCLCNLPATVTSLCVHSFVAKTEGQGEEKTAVVGMSYRAVNQRKTLSALHHHHPVLAQATSHSRTDYIAWLMCCSIEKLPAHAERRKRADQWVDKCESASHYYRKWDGVLLLKCKCALGVEFAFASVWALLDTTFNMLMTFVLFIARILENKAKLTPTCAFWFAGKQRTNLRLHQPGFCALENHCDPFVGVIS